MTVENNMQEDLKVDEKLTKEQKKRLLELFTSVLELRSVSSWVLSLLSRRNPSLVLYGYPVLSCFPSL